MASPLPSPHPDDLDAAVTGDALRLVSVHRASHFTVDTSYDGRPAADLSDVQVEVLCKSSRRRSPAGTVTELRVRVMEKCTVCEGSATRGITRTPRSM